MKEKQKSDYRIMNAVGRTTIKKPVEKFTLCTNKLQNNSKEKNLNSFFLAHSKHSRFLSPRHKRAYS